VRSKISVKEILLSGFDFARSHQQRWSAMSSEDSNLTRRDFIMQSAVLSGASAAWCSTAMKTDALAQVVALVPALLGAEGDIIPYMYGEAGP
jgi:hypothetical protein